MRMRCEVFVSDVLPCVRALVAKRMVEKYGFSQTRSARLIGLSQPAISQYMKSLRGRKLPALLANHDAIALVDRLAADISSRKMPEGELSDRLCEICGICPKV